MKKRWYFCGIAGSGMSALAQLLRAFGDDVAGSDRAFDNNENLFMLNILEKQGVEICPQTGEKLTNKDILVVSTAIESSIPDVKKAQELGIKIVHRSELLAQIFNDKFGVAVAGTSGKSSVTALIGFILHACKKSPTIINGAEMKNFSTLNFFGNFAAGKSEIVVIEADESDGSIVNYYPKIGLINNISKDHKEMIELHELFHKFAKNSDFLIVNLDCAENLQHIIKGKTCTISLENPTADFFAKNIKKIANGMEFEIEATKMYLPMIGKHNVENALMAIATCVKLGVKIEEIAEVLPNFKGIGRRMQILGTHKNRTVIDDFAHNPDKIRAILQAVREDYHRILVFFQPHGYGPTKFLFDDFVDIFINNTNENDIIYFPEIFYAGGTAQKTISSADLAKAISAKNRNAKFFINREEVAAEILRDSAENDVILLLGARDSSLGEFAEKFYEELKLTI